MWTKGHELKYWNKTGNKKGTEIYNKYRKSFNFDRYNFSNSVIGDIGCGPFGGVFFDRVDLNLYPIDILADEYNSMNLTNKKIIYGDLNKTLPFEDNFFDYIICTNAIDHINNIQHGFDEIKRILKKNGIVFIHVHLRTSDQLNKAHIHILDENKILEFIGGYKIVDMKKDTDWVNDREDRFAMYIVLGKI